MEILKGEKYKKSFQTKNPIVDWTQNPPTIVCEDYFQTVKQVIYYSKNNYNRPYYKYSYPCENFCGKLFELIDLCFKKKF